MKAVIYTKYAHPRYFRLKDLKNFFLISKPNKALFQNAKKLPGHFSVVQTEI